MGFYSTIDTQDFELRIQQMEQRIIDLNNRMTTIEGIIGDITGEEFKQVTARQWQSALAVQGKLDTVRGMVPADVNNPIAVQWSAAGVIREPPSADPVWTFTKTTLDYTDAQMTTLNTLAHAQDS